MNTGAASTTFRHCTRFFLLAVLLVLGDIPLHLWFNRPHAVLTLSSGIIASAALMLLPAVRRASERRLPDRIPGYLSPEIWCTLGVFTAFLAFYAITGNPESPYNEQVRQAVAFLHGHTYIDAPDHSYIEYAQVGAYKYALHPPLTAILLMPLALIWVMGTPETAFNIFIGAAGVALAWRLFGRFKLNTNARVWLTLFFAIGTDFWFDVISGNTWSLPMSVSVVFSFLILIELFGETRPIWLGIFGGLVCLARYDLALAMPAIAALAYMRGRSLQELLWMAPGFLAVGVVFVGLNEARFHSLFDIGVSIEGPKGRPAFSLQYLPGNLYTIFFMAPGHDSRFPYIHPTFMGQAIPLTSPAFALAFRASCRRFATHTMWFAAIAGSIASLLCYANGYAQFGTRHYIQVFPFLLVLMAMGIHRRADQLTKVLIVISIGLITFGVWHIQIYGYG